MVQDKFIKVEKEGDIYYYKCPNNTMSSNACFISMRSDLNRDLYYSLPDDAVVINCSETTSTTIPTTSPTTQFNCDLQFQSVGFINDNSFPYDYTLTKGYIKVEMTNLSRNPSYQFQILSGTTVVMDWTDPISTFTTFYFKLSCANYTVRARDYYHPSCVININNISVPCLPPPSTTLNPSCDNGSNPFTIISTTYSNNSLTYVYDAQNLVQANWVIRVGQQILHNGTVTHTSSTKTLTNVPLPNGNYTFELIGTSCTGTASKTFIVTDSTTTVPPTTLLSCNPSGGTFTIVSVNYNSTTNELNYIYDAVNLVDATWELVYNGNVFQSGTVRHLTSNITIPLVAPLSDGNYTFELIGTSCSGRASKGFTVVNPTTTTSTSTTSTTSTTTSTTTTTTTTTVPTWNPCSVYSLEAKYVDSTVSGHPKRDTKVLINNYNQFTNVYSYYGEILLASSTDYTNNGFSVASYYKFISSTSLNNVGYTLLYDPNVTHAYSVSSYNLSTNTIIDTKTLTFNNRGITNTHPEESEIRSITIDNSGNLYCASKFGIDKYSISGSTWVFVKNVTPPSYNTSLTGGAIFNLPSNSYYLLKSTMNYIPNLNSIVWTNHGDLLLLCSVDGSSQVTEIYSSFNNLTLNTFIKDNYLYLTTRLPSNDNRTSYDYTHPDGTIRTSLVVKLDVDTYESNIMPNIGTLSTAYNNLPIQKDDYPSYMITNDFVQTMACKNLYAQNQFTISEPTLTCYTSYITADFIIYGGSDNYEISIDGGTSWTHYSETGITLTLPRTTHTTNLGYEVYLVRIKNNDTGIIHNFYISNTTNCQ